MEELGLNMSTFLGNVSLQMGRLKQNVTFLRASLQHTLLNSIERKLESQGSNPIYINVMFDKTSKDTILKLKLLTSIFLID